jgi:hypothetical protein
LSRPKKTLPMADQASPETGSAAGAPPEGTDACCGPGEDCCEGGLNPAAATSKMREAGSETLGEAPPSLGWRGPSCASKGWTARAAP